VPPQWPSAKPARPTTAPRVHIRDLARLKLTRAEAWPLPRGDDRRLLVACVTAALLMHALVLSLMLPHAAPELPSGSGGQYLEAIEVTIVRSAVIESREKKPDAEAAGANSDIQLKAGDASRARPPEEAVEDAEALLQQKQTRAPASTGGETARAAEDRGRAAGPAAASPGAIAQYAAKVREALARNKPNGHGRRGTATVQFSLSASGKVVAADVANSSGVAALDRSAIEAVRATSFPTPPAGMSERQLRYVVPFNFK